MQVASNEDKFYVLCSFLCYFHATSRDLLQNPEEQLSFPCLDFLVIAGILQHSALCRKSMSLAALGRLLSSHFSWCGKPVSPVLLHNALLISLSCRKPTDYMYPWGTLLRINKGLKENWVSEILKRIYSIQNCHWIVTEQSAYWLGNKPHWYTNGVYSHIRMHRIPA